MPSSVLVAGAADEPERKPTLPYVSLLFTMPEKPYIARTIEAITAEVGVKLEGYQSVSVDAAPNVKTEDYVVNPDKKGKK
jgi:hypothetical protein